MKLIAILLISATLAMPHDKVEERELKPACTLENKTFESGEKFVFKLFYNWTAIWLSAGEIAFTVQDEVLNGRPVHHLMALGQTYKSYEWFYKVRDRYESWVDKETMLPVRFKRDAYEGGFIMKDEYNFDRVANKVYAKELHGKEAKVKGQPMKESTFDVTSCVQDAISAIYNMRCIDWANVAVGDKVPFDVYIDREVYHVYARYMGKKTVKTKLGKFNTLWIKPLMLDNEYFDGGEHMNVYVTDDDNKIPVRIETPLVVGWLKADLLSYAGLKYPFSARIK